jgi:hypothetical protein
MTNLHDIPEMYYRVKKLQRIRGHQAELKPVSISCQEWFRAFIDADFVTGREDRPTLVDSDGRPIAERRRLVYAPKRAFNTGKLKRARPTEYQRCRVLQPHHKIFASPDPVEPGEYDFTLPDVFPAVPRDWSTLDDLHAVGVTRELVSKVKLTIAPELREWNRLEKEVKDELDVIVEHYQQRGWWSGVKKEFDDGWTYGARQLKFDAKLAEQILPQWVVQQFSAMTAEREQWNTYALDPDNLKMAVDLDYSGDTEPFEGD